MPGRPSSAASPEVGGEAGGDGVQQRLRQRGPHHAGALPGDALPHHHGAPPSSFCDVEVCMAFRGGGEGVAWRGEATISGEADAGATRP